MFATIAPLLGDPDANTVRYFSRTHSRCMHELRGGSRGRVIAFNIVVALLPIVNQAKRTIEWHRDSLGCEKTLERRENKSVQLRHAVDNSKTSVVQNFPLTVRSV